VASQAYRKSFELFERALGRPKAMDRAHGESQVAEGGILWRALPGE
jgi:hypothetical protein